MGPGHLEAVVQWKTNIGGCVDVCVATTVQDEKEVKLR
jgi:hypothetical protein